MDVPEPDAWGAAVRPHLPDVTAVRSAKRTFLGIAHDDLGSLLYVVAGLLFLGLFVSVGEHYLLGFALDPGSIRFLRPLTMQFLAVWTVLGGAATWLLTLGVARLVAKTPLLDTLERRWRGLPAGAFVAAAALVAVLVPTLLRVFLLENAPLTDDESAYLFQARLLASGRLTAPSLPDELKLFLDRVFMVNDGRMYAQYFVGWPALMVPGVWLGMPEVMNALYAGATVPALFLVFRRLFGAVWAKVGVGLFLVAPFLMVAAATGLSHTSCLCALAWCAWFALRASDADSPWWSHAGVAFCFAVAFFVRPTSALGVGLPFLVFWLVGLRRQTRPGRALLAFAVPAAVMGALFLGVNAVQNGSPLRVSYLEVFAYMEANDYRFAGRGPKPAHQVHSFDFTNVQKALANLGTVLFRLNYALFGWPASLALLLVAGFGRGTRLLWASFFCYLAVHLFVDDIGIDSFGPVHYFEIALPILGLTVAGLKRLYTFGRTLDARGVGAYGYPLYRALPVVGLLCVVALSAVGYVPVRFATLHAMATEAINRPAEAVAAAGLERAVVFTAYPYASSCPVQPAVHPVDNRPNNHPDLTDEVLFVNHISYADDRRFMEYLPDRTGYLMTWTRDCRLDLRPLADLDPAQVERGLLTEAQSPDWSRVPPPAALSGDLFRSTRHP